MTVEITELTNKSLVKFLELNQREVDIFSKDVLVDGFTLHRTEVLEGYITLMPLKGRAKPMTAGELHLFLLRVMNDYSDENKSYSIFVNFDRLKADDNVLTQVAIVDGQVVLMTAGFASIEKETT